MNPLAETTQLALKATIAASDEARRCTERLAGKSIAVESLGQRLVVCFEAGAVQVEADDREADATVRGSPLALLLAAVDVEQEADSSAVFGDEAIVRDFRASFRPHLHATSMGTLVEDAGDALRLGVKAAQSALEGVARAAAGAPPDESSAAGDLRAEVAALKAQLQSVEERLQAVEAVETGAERTSKEDE